MALFTLKSLSQNHSLENAAEDRKLSSRVEQFRVSDTAIYFPAFPGDQYLPFEALHHVLSKNTAISVTGTCGKQLPMIRLRLSYDGEFYKDFLFEQQKNADRVIEKIRACGLLPEHAYWQLKNPSEADTDAFAKVFYVDVGSAELVGLVEEKVEDFF